jgi:hypothetical protein
MIPSFGCHHMRIGRVFLTLLRSMPIGYTQSISDTMFPDLEGSSVHSCLIVLDAGAVRLVYNCIFLF